MALKGLKASMVFETSFLSGISNFVESNFVWPFPGNSESELLDDVGYVVEWKWCSKSFIKKELIDFIHGDHYKSFVKKFLINNKSFK